MRLRERNEISNAVLRDEISNAVFRDNEISNAA